MPNIFNTHMASCQPLVSTVSLVVIRSAVIAATFFERLAQFSSINRQKNLESAVPSTFRLGTAVGHIENYFGVTANDTEGICGTLVGHLGVGKQVFCCKKENGKM